MSIEKRLHASVIAGCSVTFTKEEAKQIIDLIDMSSAKTAQSLKAELEQTRSLQQRLHLRLQKQEAILAESKRYNQGFSDGHRIGRGEMIDETKKIRTLERRVAILRERVRAMREIIDKWLNQ